MNLIARTPVTTYLKALFVLILLSLTGCSLPKSSTRALVYDFGPGPLTQTTRSPSNAAPALILSDVLANPALDSNAMLYRLAYTNAQQLQPYAQARWSTTPAQLLRQRLREQLGQQHALLNPGEQAPRPSGSANAALTLRIELEEFSQLFSSPTHSVGLLRLRATLSQNRPGAEPWLVQRHIVVQRPAASADAHGGVRALSEASDEAAQQLQDWLHSLTQTQPKPTPS